MPYIDTKYLFTCETCRRMRDGRCTTFCDWGEMYSPNITKIPTANVEKVKYGKWILEYGTYGKMICSECKNEAPITNKRDNSLQLQTLYVDSPYCHHCGAKMDRERKR